MTTNEFYYLVLVLGAFAAFAVGTILATIQYKTWLRRQPAVAVAARHVPDKDANRSRGVRQLADAA